MNSHKKQNNFRSQLVKLITAGIQFIKFSIVGLFNTGLNYIIYSSLVFVGLHYLLSNTVAWAIGILVSYLLNTKLVFNTTAKKSAMAKTYVVYGVSYLVTQIGMVVLVDFINLSEFLAPLVMLLFSVPFNFFSMKYWAIGINTRRLVVFDLDGTLFATHPGITSSMEAVLIDNGLQKPNEKMLEELLLGGSTAMLIKNNYGLAADDIRRVIREYRLHYLQFGIYNCKPYDGISDLLETLYNKNCMIAIASLKRENVLKELVELKGFANYFDLIVGNNDDCTITKAQMLRTIADTLNASPDNTTMVGDSYYDYDAAKMLGCDFIGVTYGYGFNAEEISRLNDVTFVDSVDGVGERLGL